MKSIKLIGSQIVGDGLRYDHEGAIEVSDAEAARLDKAGALLEAPRAVRAAPKPRPTRQRAERRKPVSPVKRADKPVTPVAGKAVAADPSTEAPAKADAAPK